MVGTANFKIFLSVTGFSYTFCQFYFFLKGGVPADVYCNQAALLLLYDADFRQIGSVLIHPGANRFKI